MIEVSADRIEPSSDMRAALARTLSSFGESVRGTYALEWYELHGCLCIVQTNVRGKRSVCIKIENGDGSPRQANLDDIEDFRRQLHRRLNAANWAKDFYARKDEERAKLKRDRRAMAEDGAKELIRIFRNPVTISMSVPEKDETVEGYKVIDKRRKFEETA